MFPITKTLCKKYTISSGLSAANQPNIINDTLHLQLVIGFLKADALNEIKDKRAEQLSVADYQKLSHYIINHV